jgi:MSHA biogenesis protein MshK
MNCQDKQNRKSGTDHVFIVLRTLGKTWSVPVFLLLIPLQGWAASFPDPTRPASYTPAAAPVAAGRPRLESVLIAPDRRIAIISGQRVQVGDRIYGAEVVSITESEVVLRSGQASETLALFPQLKRDSR